MMANRVMLRNMRNLRNFSTETIATKMKYFSDLTDEDKKKTINRHIVYKNKTDDENIMGHRRSKIIKEITYDTSEPNSEYLDMQINKDPMILKNIRLKNSNKMIEFIMNNKEFNTDEIDEIRLYVYNGIYSLVLINGIKERNFGGIVMEIDFDSVVTECKKKMDMEDKLYKFYKKSTFFCASSVVLLSFIKFYY